MTCVDNTVGRVLVNKQDGATCAMAAKEVFLKTSKDYPVFKMGSDLEEIVVDFCDAESNGFQDAIGEYLAAKLLRGCNVSANSSNLPTCTVYIHILHISE